MFYWIYLKLKKIDETVNKIIEFKPDILFSVDSPDFTLRVSEKVKKINPNIKTIHFVAPQVWVWREGRVKKFKKSGVLVKFPKKKQDLRVDLPTIGLKTLKQCKTAGLKGIVLKSKKNVFLESKKSIIFSNKNKMFVTVVWKKYLY